MARTNQLTAAGRACRIIRSKSSSSTIPARSPSCGWLFALAGLPVGQRRLGEVPKPQVDGRHAAGRLLEGSIACYGQPHSDVAFDWYAGFLNNLVGATPRPGSRPLVAFGEFLAGICLILGLFTGAAALIAGLYELQFHAGRQRGGQPALLPAGVRAGDGLEERGLVGTGPLRTARCSARPGTPAPCSTPTTMIASPSPSLRRPEQMATSGTEATVAARLFRGEGRNATHRWSRVWWMRRSCWT